MGTVLRWFGIDSVKIAGWVRLLFMKAISLLICPWGWGICRLFFFKQEVVSDFAILVIQTSVRLLPLATLIYSAYQRFAFTFQAPLSSFVTLFIVLVLISLLFPLSLH